MPMLWIGLVVWLGSMLIMAIMEWTGNSPEGQETVFALGKMMFQRIPVLTLLLFCVFQPILEEFSFRLWGEGKKWTTIVCLVLMTVFAVSEIHWWGLLFVAALALAWFGVKDRFIQMWACALISALCFALCHISGFGSFSVGMVLGLTDIFGFALVLSWLAINISIWLAALLHILNNSWAIIIPLLFLSDPMSLPCYSMADGKKNLDYTISIEPLKPFADNSVLLGGADCYINYYDSTKTDLCLVGEPAELATLLTSGEGVYYDWKSKNESLEDRVVFRVEGMLPGTLASQRERLFTDYLKLVEAYTGNPLVFDTTEVMLKEIWLVYADGREELLGDSCEDRIAAMERVMSNNRYGLRGNTIYQNSEMLEDSIMVTRYYCLLRSNPIADQFNSLNEMQDKMAGFKIDYRDAKKATMVVVR